MCVLIYILYTCVTLRDTVNPHSLRFSSVSTVHLVHSVTLSVLSKVLHTLTIPQDLFSTNVFIRL